MAIRVLMVTDGEGSYHEAGERFGLTELVGALEAAGTCVVTKAHRWPDTVSHTAGADITGFRFNGSYFNPDDYDEVWLMGFASSNPDGPYGDPDEHVLSNAEAEVLGAFMNGGGGVFATGDHDDLGRDLCGKVPRVRNMRYWEADYSVWDAYEDGQDFESIVPDPSRSPVPIGPYRLDTLQTGHNAHFEFQDQSDDVPQQIRPVMHVVSEHVTGVAGGVFGIRELAPHPLLCGANGIIRVLPDHMHEGRCRIPDDLASTFAISGTNHDEFPEVPGGGARVSPEVVAWARVKARTKDPYFDDPTESVRDPNTDVHADEYPVIAAYNGRPASVGRVVVDATFHHFVNINVSGVKPEFDYEPPAQTAIKSQGFNASPAGQAHYGQIREYWRNIARWIARPSATRAAGWASIASVASDPRLKQTTPRGRADTVPAGALVRFGASAWKLFGEQMSDCHVMDFFIDIAIPHPMSYLIPSLFIKLTLPDPPPYERIRRDLKLDRRELLYYAMGAAMLELRQPELRQALLSRRLTAEKGLAVFSAAAQTGLQRGLEDQMHNAERALSALQQAVALGREQSTGRQPG